MTAPLFRDPIHDGATDPVLVQHRGDGSWWMFYTQRRADVPGEGVAWVHGADIGVATSDNGGVTFLYRGTLDLATGWGRDTFWAPEIIWAGGTYHMYVSVIEGTPVRWEGHDSHTWAADSTDLVEWHVVGPVITGGGHEGPNVFTLGGWHWMLVDEWRGLAVYRSDDLTAWARDGLILDRPGTRPDDGGIGMHADVVVLDDGAAHVVYFTHPGRSERPGQPGTGPGGGLELGEMRTASERRSSIQAARLRVVAGHLVCDRDEPLAMNLPTTVGPTDHRSSS